MIIDSEKLADGLYKDFGTLCGSLQSYANDDNNQHLLNVVQDITILKPIVRSLKGRFGNLLNQHLNYIIIYFSNAIKANNKANFDAYMNCAMKNTVIG